MVTSWNVGRRLCWQSRCRARRIVFRESHVIVLIGWRFLQVMTVGKKHGCELSITPIRIGISHRFVQLVNVLFLGGTSWTALRRMGPFRRLLTSAFHLGSGIIYTSILDLTPLFSMVLLSLTDSRCLFFLFSKSNFLVRWIPPIIATTWHDMLLWVYGYGIQYPKYAVYDIFIFLISFANFSLHELVTKTKRIFFFGKRLLFIMIYIMVIFSGITSFFTIHYISILIFWAFFSHFDTDKDLFFFVFKIQIFKEHVCMLIQMASNWITARRKTRNQISHQAHSGLSWSSVPRILPRGVQIGSGRGTCDFGFKKIQQRGFFARFLTR